MLHSRDVRSPLRIQIAECPLYLQKQTSPSTPACDLRETRRLSWSSSGARCSAWAPDEAFPTESRFVGRLNESFATQSSESDRRMRCHEMTPCATFGLAHRSKQAHHSMSWSARRRKGSEIVSPSAFAVLRLITSSNLVGCWTGNSPGFAPLRMRSTYDAARRN